MSLTRRKETRETEQWREKGNRENDDTPHACIPVSLAVLGLFNTPTEALAGLNVIAQVVENE